MNFALLIKSHDRDEQRVELSGPKFMIGKSSECNLVLDDTSISRQHCSVRFSDGVVDVEDLNSTNGCYFEQERTNRFSISYPHQSFIIGPYSIKIVELNGY